MTKDTRGWLRIGTSGYQYDHWKGLFYPGGLPKSKWFEYYASNFCTVEINTTFYRLPETKVFDAWRDRAPSEFCYALKFSRYGTHFKRLGDPRPPIDLFVERASHLDDFIGPILIQLPPRWHVNMERLVQFLDDAYFNNDACAYAVKNARELMDITVGNLNGANDDIRSSAPFTFQGA